MATKAELAVVKTLVGAELQELLFKTTDAGVKMADGRTLAAFLTDYLTEEQVDAKFAALVDGAPEAFDTLKEIADRLAADETLHDTIVGAIADKVDKVAGKGLSTEDFTSTLKAKLEGLQDYTHPSTHSADIITESTTKKFMTPEEKAKLQNMGRVLIDENEPSDLAEGDVWIQPLSESE